MSEDIFSKKENAFDALLEEFGVTEGVEAPPTTNDFSDLFGTEPPAEPEKTAETKKAPSFDDLLADMPTTKVEASPKSNDLNVPTKAEETPSLFDDLLADAKPAKPKKEKKEPEHIPDKSEDYRVPNDVLHLNKVPKPDNSWEAEAADIVVPEVKPKDTKGPTPTKGANPFGNTTPGAAPTKGANPFGNTAPTKGATPTKGANPFGNTTKGATPTKGANPFGNATKGANPFDNPTATPDNFNPFIKQEPAKEALWTSPDEFDYDQLAEKIVEKLIQKIAQKLK
jgi:mucin-2, putative